jgi:nitrite reductase/ring-hydroxylating ferredoxin subunit
MTIPEAGLRLCQLAEIPDGGCIGVAGMVVCRSGSSVRAYLNLCPHLSLPLDANRGDFLLDGPEQVMCVYHCSVFRFADGLCVRGPARTLHLDAVPVQVVAGDVLVGNA